MVRRPHADHRYQYKYSDSKHGKRNQFAKRFRRFVARKIRQAKRKGYTNVSLYAMRRSE